MVDSVVQVGLLADPPEAADADAHSCTLATRLRAGDSQVFDVLMAVYGRPIEAIGRRLGAASWDRAELVQDVMLRVLEHRKRFEHDKHVAGFILLTARNLATDRWRKRGRWSIVPLAAESRSHNSSPEQEAQLREAIALLSAFRDELDPFTRACFDGYFGAELSEDALKDSLNVSRSVIRRRLRKLKRALDELLDHKSGDEP